MLPGQLWRFAEPAKVSAGAGKRSTAAPMRSKFLFCSKSTSMHAYLKVGGDETRRDERAYSESQARVLCPRHGARRRRQRPGFGNASGTAGRYASARSAVHGAGRRGERARLCFLGTFFIRGGPVQGLHRKMRGGADLSRHICVSRVYTVGGLFKFTMLGYSNVIMCIAN